MISRKKTCLHLFTSLTFTPEILSINFHSGANIFGQHCIPGNRMKTRWMKRNFILWNWTWLKEVLCTTETIYLLLLRKKNCFEWGENWYVYLRWWLYMQIEEKQINPNSSQIVCKIWSGNSNSTNKFLFRIRNMVESRKRFQHYNPFS